MFIQHWLIIQPDALAACQEGGDIAPGAAEGGREALDGSASPHQKANSADADKNRSGGQRRRCGSGAAELTRGLDDHHQPEHRSHNKRDPSQTKSVHGDVVSTSPSRVDRPARHLAREHEAGRDQYAPGIRHRTAIKQRPHVQRRQSAHRPLHGVVPTYGDTAREQRNATARDDGSERRAGRRHRQQDVGGDAAVQSERDRPG